MSTEDNSPIKKTDPAAANSFTTVTEASTTSPDGNQRDVETGAAKMARASGSRDPSAGDMVKETKDAAKARASELADKAKREAQGMGERAKSMAGDGAEHAKDYASEQIDRQAESLRSAGRRYGDESYQAYAADYLANNLSQAADILREKDMGSLVADVNLFARRNPALFLGGAAILGFGLARLMKASEPSRRYADYDDRRLDTPQAGVRNTPYGREPARPATYNGSYR